MGKGKKDFNKVVSQHLSEAMKFDSYQELLSHLLNLVALIERKLYLENNPGDKGNGFRQRRLHAGSLTFDLSVPRTRRGGFRPFFLPEKWKRHSETDYINLVHSLILSSKSIEAAKRALKELGIPYSEEEFERMLEELREEIEVLNRSQLNPDWFALVMDGKEVKVRDKESVKAYTIYTVVGIGLDGRKEIILMEVKEGREKIEEWKRVLKRLMERGVRRVLIVVHDDFSGLLSMTKDYFPGADVQLCTVHLMRNAKRRLSEGLYKRFVEGFKAIKASMSYEDGAGIFERMCEEIGKENREYSRRLRERMENYLAFLRYPEEVRGAINSTNMVEGLNRKIEDSEMMNGGYFHSMDNLKLKLSVMVKELKMGKWRRPSPKIAHVSHVLNVIFEERFKNA